MLGFKVKTKDYSQDIKVVNNIRSEQVVDNLINIAITQVPINDSSIADKEKNDNTANNVVIKYSNYQTTSYSYDSENKYYLRYMNDEAHIDKISKEQLHYKNIIIEKVRNSTLDSYGRQDLDTTGSGEGYYITNGYVKEITWTKNSRSGKTTYTYEDGKEVKINDGNTFIQIIPVTVTPEIS